jgi:hypothetical protein
MKELIEKLRRGEFEFGRREKLWALGLVVVTVLVWGNGLILRPRAAALAQAKADFISARNTLEEVESQKPDIESKRSRIRELQKQVGSSYRELDGLEKGLLYSQDQDLLLERLVADRKRFQMQINAVEPVREEGTSVAKPSDKAVFYKQLQVKVDASSAYDNLISYVASLEDQGPYQKVRSFRVEMDKEEKALPRSRVLVEVLLSDTTVKKAELREKVIAMIDEELPREPRDPFLASDRPREEEELTGLELSGIFGAGARLTALIDGNAYQEGDVIQGKRIVQIQPDRVIFEQGNKRYFLYERSAQ